MTSLTVLSTSLLESLLVGVAIGIALVIVIAAVLPFIGRTNAATRGLIWMSTLLALPLVQVAYFAGHDSHPPPRAAVQTAPAAPAALVPIPTVPDPLPTRASAPLQIPTPPNFGLNLLSLYMVVVVALLLRLCISYLRVRRLRNRTTPAPAALTERLSVWLTRCPTFRPLELRLSDHVRSPLAIGWLRPMIVMPTALVLELSREDLDDLGVHELAHLRRYDDWTNLLQRLLQALLFFHPAAHYVGRRLNFEREVACDDWVISSQETGSYVRCLAKVVELRNYQRGAMLLSSGAFFGKRQILKRVESLLDRTRNTATSASGLSFLAAAVILAVIAVQAAHLPAVVAFTEEQIGTSTTRWTDGSHDLRINSRGEFTFSPDERSLASISPDGFLLIDESEGWSHRRLEIRPGPSGAPEEQYFLDGRRKPMDGVGRAWAAGCYLRLLREVGWDAEGRVHRLLTARGASGVLSEVDLIHSDGVKRQYLTQLLEQTALSNSDMQRLADCVRKIGSDSDKADFLIAHQRDFATDELRNSYFRAVNSIQSDGDRRRVLTGVLETDGSSLQAARLVLGAARTISSDSDKAGVLTNAAYSESDSSRTAFFAVANTINSSSDRTNVLLNLLKQANLQPETYRGIASSAATIDSDNDKANLLTQLAAHYNGPAFFEAANTIQSGNDRARVLQAVLDTKPAPSVLVHLVECAAELAGDNEKADVLLAVAKQSADPAVQAVLRQACRKIASDSDYRRVASAIFEGSN